MMRLVQGSLSGYAQLHRIQSMCHEARLGDSGGVRLEGSLLEGLRVSSCLHVLECHGLSSWPRLR